MKKKTLHFFITTDHFKVKNRVRKKNHSQKATRTFENKNFIRRFSSQRAFETHLTNQKTKFGRDAELFKRDESAT